MSNLVLIDVDDLRVNQETRSENEIISICSAPPPRPDASPR